MVGRGSGCFRWRVTVGYAPRANRPCALMSDPVHGINPEPGRATGEDTETVIAPTIVESR